MQGTLSAHAGPDLLGAHLLHRRRGDHHAAHRLARRRASAASALFIIAVAGFTVASMLCGAAPASTEMVLFRVLQGVFGAALVPLSQAVLLDIYPREQHGQAMAIWGVGIMVGADHRPDARRLADRALQLALGVLHQPAGRHAGALRPHRLRAGKTPMTRQRAVRSSSASRCSPRASARFQLMLDRGQQLDWFSSPEIVGEALVAGVAFCDVPRSTR